MASTKNSAITSAPFMKKQFRNINESVFVKKELAQDVFEYRTSVFGQKNKMGGYKNPKLFLHRDPILYLWKDMKDQVVEELQSIYRNKSPQGMIFEGDSGSGASELIRSLSTELSACGLLDPVSLRYLKSNGQGGIYEALKEDIFPYGESIRKCSAEKYNDIGYISGVG